MDRKYLIDLCVQSGSESFKTSVDLWLINHFEMDKIYNMSITGSINTAITFRFITLLTLQLKLYNLSCTLYFFARFSSSQFIMMHLFF